MSRHSPRALSGPVCVYQRRATCSEGLPPTYAHRSGSTNPRHSKLLGVPCPATRRAPCLGRFAFYQRRATCSEGLPPTYAHRSGSTNPRHSKLLMRFNGGVCQSTASIVGSIVGSIGSRAGTSGPSLSTFTTGFTINRHVSPRHARPGGTRPFPRIPLAIEISGGWSDGEENASAALGAFEKPHRAAASPRALLRRVLDGADLEVLFARGACESGWRGTLNGDSWVASSSGSAGRRTR